MPRAPQMVYRFRSGTFNAKPAIAQAVGERLEALRVDAEGELAPADVVSDARRPDSPLHAFFEWNDRKAAIAHRATEADKLVRAVVVIVPDGDAPVPAFQRVVVDGEATPRFTRAAQQSFARTKDLRADQLERALRELELFRRRFAQLDELGPVMRAIDETLEHPVRLAR
jgi:hypothetical protein